MSTVTQYTLRRLTPADKPVVRSLLVREWGAVEVAALSIGGVGAALVSALVDDCRARTLRFYQRAGFQLVALRVDAITEARKLKPEIPSHGLDDIPIRDEIELTMELP